MDDPYSIILGFEFVAGSVGEFAAYAVCISFLLFLSGLISGSEVAFFSLGPDEIAECKKNKSSESLRVLSLLKRPKRLLANILILNNLVNITLIVISTLAASRMLGVNINETVELLGLTVTMTFLIVFLGEVVPKVYANQNNVSFAMRTSSLLGISSKVLYPIASVLMSFGNLIERKVERKGYDITMDELAYALELTGDDTSEEEKEILMGIVNFSNLSAKQVMTSRMDINALDIELSYPELLKEIKAMAFSRVPVFKETIDKVEGILYIKDLLPYLDDRQEFSWQTLLRPGFFVPESKKIDTLLRDFQEKRVHMAIVVDEYGGTSGLITMEDIIEEIVGEISDEFDDDDVNYNKLDNNTFVFEGKTSLNDFSKVIDVDPAFFEEIKGESESLGGLMLEINSKMPRPGEKIRFENMVFTAVSVDTKRIKKVRVFIKK